MLTWSTNCVIAVSTGTGTFAINDAKLYVLLVTLWTHDNTKLLRQLKSRFNHTINWNKYQSKVSKQHKINIYNLKIMQLEQETQDIFFQL